MKKQAVLTVSTVKKTVVKMYIVLFFLLDLKCALVVCMYLC